MNPFALHGTFAVILVSFAPPVELDSRSPDRAPRELSFAQPATDAKAPKLDLEDPLSPLQPAKPRTVSTQERIEALAWYMAGRLSETRNDLPSAYAAYQKAFEHDPNSLSILQSLIQLAFSLNHTEEGLTYAMRAVDLDPSDVQLMQRLGKYLKDQDAPGAIKLFERALKSPALKKDSVTYVSLMRDLGVLYKSMDRIQESADCLQVVFDAMQNHAKYGLDARTRKILETDPETDYEKLGQIFLEAGRSELAIDAFKKAAGKGKSLGSLSYNLARVYLQTKQPENALEELQKYLDQQRQSKERDAYELLASILEQAGKSNELIPRLEDLAGKDTRNSYLQFFLADQYRKANRYGEAEALYKKTLTYSSALNGYVGLADVYRSQNRPQELLETLAKAYAKTKGLKGLDVELKAIQEDDKLVATLLETGRKLAAEAPPRLDFPSSHILAWMAAKTKHTAESQEFYRLALTLNKEQAGELYLELGDHLRANLDFAAAAKLYQDALEDPAAAEQRHMILYRASEVFELNGDTKGALEAIAAVQQLIPNNPQIQFQEGWIYYHSQQFDEAAKRFEKLIATMSKSQEPKVPGHQEILRQTQFMLSNVHVQQGDIRKGEVILEEILKDDPDDPAVNNDLGYLYADQDKNLEQAESMITKAVTKDPDNAAYLDSMGWVLFKRGKFAEAVPYLEKATKSLSSDATIHDHLADALDRAKEPARALEAWNRALEMAKKASKPDTKLIGRIEEKIKNHSASSGKLRPERPQSP